MGSYLPKRDFAGVLGGSVIAFAGGSMLRAWRSLWTGLVADPRTAFGI